MIKFEFNFTSMNHLDQGCIYSFGEEGMQLVQPSKFFSCSCYRQYWHARVRTWAMLLFKISMSVQLLCELHALFSEGVFMPLNYSYD